MTQEKALKTALAWIDSVPSAMALPAMPGFDRDVVDRLMIHDQYEDAPSIEYQEAIEMALEWIDAVPSHFLAQLPPFDRQAIQDAIGGR